MAPLAPDVRSQFAKRLKSLRTHRGFERARYFAKALGIEENRYTRYERAEVEPNLTLIHQMCERLGVTPNELLGYPDYIPGNSHFVGMAESSRSSVTSRTPEHESRRDSLAWRLATEVVAVRNEDGSNTKSAGDPLNAFRETGALFRKLQSDPYNAVAEFLSDPALEKLGSGRKSELAGLIRSFTDSLS
jgi:transcriptional regulator with XRE-family HTH domain